MIYDWYCDKCDIEKETIESIKEYTGVCSCDQCGNDMRRLYTPTQIIGAEVQNPYYCHGLGKVVKNKYDVSEECKKRGVAQVGNDFTSGDKMEKTFEKQRREKLEKRYEF